MLLLLLLICVASFQVSLSLDTLRQGDSLNTTSSLVSSGNNSSLQFYSPYHDNNNYLAIFDMTGLAAAVWIGNRDNPVSSNYSLMISSRTGSLLITNGEGYAFPLYVSSETRQNVSAILLDTYNFVLKEASASGEDVILWQSFDHPTSTFLQEMKLGVDRRTGSRRKLTSRSNYGDPASGPFTLEWEIITHRLIIRHRGVFHWTSGRLIDYYDNDYNLSVKKFENLPAPNPVDFNYNFTNISSNDEDWFMYSLIQVPNVTPADRMVSKGWFLTQEGKLFEISGGNLITSCDDSGVIPGCRCNDQRQPSTSYGYFWLPNGESLSPVPDDNSDIDMNDCRESCWSDCDCAGFTHEPETGCRYWIGRNLKFERKTGPSYDFIYIRGPGSSNNSTSGSSSNSTSGSSNNSTSGSSSNSTSGSSNNSTSGSSSNSTSGSSNDRKRMLMWIIIAVVTAILLLLIVAALVLMRRSKQRKKEAEMNELLLLTEVYDRKNGGSKGHNLRPFTYATLIAATSNFSSEYKLGEGGFGPVYKGQTTEGEEIAVKVLSRSSGQGLLEFKNEITLISKLQHVNLVKLVGFCIHGEDKLIVYDYMPNKSLDFFLFDPTKKEQLDWGRRFNIIDGISQGLLYLHKYSRLNIVHRDLKSSNILLDENLNPKISDFGLARIFKQNADEANTNRRVGTYGYMAPEYAMQGMFSFKSDVYSFGVLLLEIVSGRRNSSFQHIDGPLNLVEYAWELWSKDSVFELMDPTLSDSCNIEQLQRCVIIGLLCVENRASDRPNIEGVISMLKNEMMPLPIPQNPAFITRNRVLEELGKSTTGKLSANEISISETGGR